MLISLLPGAQSVTIYSLDEAIDQILLTKKLKSYGISGTPLGYVNVQNFNRLQIILYAKKIYSCIILPHFTYASTIIFIFNRATINK